VKGVTATGFDDMAPKGVYSRCAAHTVKLNVTLHFPDHAIKGNHKKALIR